MSHAHATIERFFYINRSIMLLYLWRKGRVIICIKYYQEHRVIIHAACGECLVLRHKCRCFIREPRRKQASEWICLICWIGDHCYKLLLEPNCWGSGQGFSWANPIFFTGKWADFDTGHWFFFKKIVCSVKQKISVAIWNEWQLLRFNHNPNKDSTNMLFFI